MEDTASQFFFLFSFKQWIYLKSRYYVSYLNSIFEAIIREYMYAAEITYVIEFENEFDE